MSKRRKPAQSAVNTEGWLMSYADMTTILLSLFIVLTTLGKDQTGVNFEKGIESFRESRRDLGLPGMFSSSAALNQNEHLKITYPVEPEKDGDAAKGRSIDAEEERFQSFLGELQRLFETRKMPAAEGEATVDLFAPLNERAPLLKSAHWDVLRPILHTLDRRDFRVTVIVWTPTPGARPWGQTAQRANGVLGELVPAVAAEARGRLVVRAQPWPYRDFQRPALSVAVTKTRP